MPKVLRCWPFLPLFLLLSLLSACGGGGTSSAPVAPVDPSSAYTGVKTQARLSQSNAERVALNGFAGGSIAGDLAGTIPSKRTSATAVEADPRLRLVTKTMQQSTRRMQLPGVARARLKARANSRSAKAVGRQVTEQVPGPDGGSASFTLNINESTGAFYGSVTYQGYAMGSTVISGTSQMMGTFDLNYEKVSRMTLSFKSLEVHVGSTPVTLVGSVSWAANLAAGSETETINIVWLEAGNAYWWNDLKIATTDLGTSLKVTFSGRYYQFDEGYVDIGTGTPLIVNYGYNWPSQGSVVFSGAAGTSAALRFQPRKLDVGVDGDGNGTVVWFSERATNDQAEANSAPVAAAGPDQQAGQGAVVSLDGSGSSDPDGDPLLYSWQFESCPDGACPGITDSNTAKPSFIAYRAGTYTLQLRVSDGKVDSSPDTVAVVSSAPQASDANLLHPQWQYGTFGQSIGKAGLISKDLNGDGIPEAIASASPDDAYANYFWYVLRRGDSGGYVQSWRSEIYSRPMLRLALADLTADGKDDIVVTLADGTILVYDTVTLTQTKSLKVEGELTASAIADVDGDGKKEIVTSDGIGVRVYSAGGVLKWSLDNGGGTTLAVGNVDGDPAQEIVTSSYGGKGYVIDGTSRAVQWEYANGFGPKIEVADLDGDGMAEIVGGTGWQNIMAFEADRKGVAWQIATAEDIGALLLKDADGDGVPEIIYGDGQWGKIHAIDAVTRQEKWAVPFPENGADGVALDDLDGNGKMEVLWGSGGRDSGADHLYVADPSTGAVRWRSLDFGGMAAVAVGDMDRDGKNEIVTVAQETESGYSAGIIQVFDAATHRLKYVMGETARSLEDQPYIAIADLDGDGWTELVVATSDLYAGVIQVYDGNTLALKRQSTAYRSTPCQGVAVADVDGDGQLETVTTAGGKVLVLDGNLQEKWRSGEMGRDVYDLKIADLDGDGHADIIVSLLDSKVAVYDGVNHELKNAIDMPARALAIADIDGDGGADLLVGRTDGLIYVYDGKTFAWKKGVWSLASAPIDALRVGDVTGAGSAEWIVSSGDTLTVLGKGGAGLVWRSAPLSRHLGAGNHLAVLDSEGDGRANVIVGSGNFLYDFE